MPGEFYIEGKQEKLDITDIKNLISQIQASITQVQSDVTSIVTTAGMQLSRADFWSAPIEEAQVLSDLLTVSTHHKI